MSLWSLMLVVAALCIMQKAREFKAGGRACAFCNRYTNHAPWCPARGGEGF